LVIKAEKYLRDYCEGKQEDDERARLALKVFSVYRRILKVEKERKEIKAEWEKLVAVVNQMKKSDKENKKRQQNKRENTIKNRR
jgi:hypothetical protein